MKHMHTYRFHMMKKFILVQQTQTFMLIFLVTLLQTLKNEWVWAFKISLFIHI